MSDSSMVECNCIVVNQATKKVKEVITYTVFDGKPFCTSRIGKVELGYQVYLADPSYPDSCGMFETANLRNAVYSVPGFAADNRKLYEKYSFAFSQPLTKAGIKDRLHGYFPGYEIFAVE